MGQVLRTGRKVGRMFEVHDLKIPSQVVPTTTAITTLSLDLWHARLGHTIFISSSIVSFSMSFRFNSVSKI